ncbi:MAG TPA: hypothetical protein VK971_13785 [Thiohalobacter sp.]|nr:hypothetical protein [Thiohalobacter sp.]
MGCAALHPTYPGPAHLRYNGGPDPVALSGNGARRRPQILEWGQQAVDHPRHPAIVETDYLKAMYCRLVKD